MKKSKLIVCGVAVLALSVSLVGCVGIRPHHDGDKWKKNNFDTSINVDGAGMGKDNANADGWYMTLSDDFDGTELNESTKIDGVMPEGGVWTYSPHQVRAKSQINADKDGNNGDPEYTSYWCPNMVKVKDGNVEITSYQTDNHNCDICPKVGRFTGGFETRAIIDPNGDNKGTQDNILWGQAFGYYETRVKFPKAPGMWSAFWLQASSMRQVGNEGRDGTEIDVYESAFLQHNKDGEYSYMGHALLWDGYGKSAKVEDYMLRTDKVDELNGVDLYDGEYHTFALKWTPEYYVFYIDGVATWATNGGEVSRIAQFLRFTVEMDAGDTTGPHGMYIGAFDPESKPVFYVDYVRVYQNKSFLDKVQDINDFTGTFDDDN